MMSRKNALSRSTANAKGNSVSHDRSSASLSPRQKLIPATNVPTSSASKKSKEGSARVLLLRRQSSIAAGRSNSTVRNELKAS